MGGVGESGEDGQENSDQSVHQAPDPTGVFKSADLSGMLMSIAGKIMVAQANRGETECFGYPVESSEHEIERKKNNNKKKKIIIIIIIKKL